MLNVSNIYESTETSDMENEDGPGSLPLIVPLSEHLDLDVQESYCFDVKIEVRNLFKCFKLRNSLTIGFEYMCFGIQSGVFLI